MNAISSALRHELRDVEYSEGYAESFLDSYVATQIKVLREQRGFSQPRLAALVGTTQPGISRIENVNYSSWNIGTLKKLARAFNVRLKISFEPYGTLPEEVERFSREALQRPAREDDPGLRDTPVNRLVASNNLAAFNYNLHGNIVNVLNGEIGSSNAGGASGIFGYMGYVPSEQIAYNISPNATDYYLGANAYEAHTIAQYTTGEDRPVEQVRLAGSTPIALAA
jgi:transcriptional regulator with XRE-family HTH domain